MSQWKRDCWWIVLAIHGYATFILDVIVLAWPCPHSKNPLHVRPLLMEYIWGERWLDYLSHIKMAFSLRSPYFRDEKNRKSYVRGLCDKNIMHVSWTKTMFSLRYSSLKLEENSFPFSNNFKANFSFRLCLHECDRDGLVRFFLVMRIVFVLSFLRSVIYSWVVVCTGINGIHGVSCLERCICWFVLAFVLFRLWRNLFHFWDILQMPFNKR